MMDDKTLTKYFEDNKVQFVKISDWAIYCQYPFRCDTEDDFNRAYNTFQKIKQDILSEYIFNYSFTFVTPEGRGLILIDDPEYQKITIENKEKIIEFCEDIDFNVEIEDELEEYKEPILVISINHKIRMAKYILKEKTDWDGTITTSDFLKNSEYMDTTLWLFNNNYL